MRRTIMSGGFLSRLRRDIRGNVMAMMAAGLFPLMGVLGGALDMSRIYLVKSRLQQACDAGALAGRRAMVNGVWTVGPGSSQEAATTFFNANYTPGRYGVQAGVPSYTAGTDQIVHGSATANVPMTLMRIFGNRQVALTVTCVAQLQLPNTDVMFVLDNTLSMNDTNPGDSQSKLNTLKSAVQSFYTALQNSSVPGTQIRYGFVPYSSNVNVGLLLKREWMVDNWTYQSRVGNWVQTNPGSTQGSTTTTNTNYSAWSGSVSSTQSTSNAESCNAPPNESYSDNTTYTAWNPSSTALPRSRTGTRTINGTTYSASRNTSTGVCTITKTAYNNYSQTFTQTVDNNPNAGQQNNATYSYYYDYKPVSINVSALKGGSADGVSLMAGGTVSVPNMDADTTNHAFKARTVTWGTSTVGACIEERKTLHTDDVTGTAYDMDVDLVPDVNNDDTRWRPALPEVEYARSVTNYYPTSPNPITGWTYAPVLNTTAGYINLGSYYSGTYRTDFASCPAASQKLQTMTSSGLTTYLSKLKATGRTYLDIGFLWGLRLMSPDGIFASENKVAPNGGAIARNIIFMTDGYTETNIADYDAYGLAALDRRRTANASTTLPTDTAQNAIVEDRLSKYCSVAKAKGITVWVIAFGSESSITPLLSGCATDSSHAFKADNSAQLADTFAKIAANLAQLRLTQ